MSLFISVLKYPVCTLFDGFCARDGWPCVCGGNKVGPEFGIGDSWVPSLGIFIRTEFERIDPSHQAVVKDRSIREVPSNGVRRFKVKVNTVVPFFSPLHGVLGQKFLFSLQRSGDKIATK